MTVNMEKALAFGKSMLGKITYSMYGSRYCTDGTCDCSGFVYRMLREGGGAKWNYIPSTETLHAYLIENGFQLIAENKSWSMQRGDVVIWGRKGYSAGANGHTGICIDNQNWYECTAWKNLGCTQQNHDSRLAMAGYPYWYVYRQKGTTTNTSKPATSTSKPKTHDQAVAASPVKHQGNAYGKLEYLNMPSKGKLKVRGWLVPDKPTGAIGSQACIILLEKGTNKELARMMVPCTKRPDVKKAYGYKGGEHLGMEATFDVSWMKGKKVTVLFRRCNKSNGEGAVNDVHIVDIYFTV